MIFTGFLRNSRLRIIYKLDEEEGNSKPPLRRDVMKSSEMSDFGSAAFNQCTFIIISKDFNPLTPRGSPLMSKVIWR